MTIDTAGSGTVRMPAAFARTSLPGRIVFGDGAVVLLAGELDQRDLRRAMLIVATTRSWQSAAATSWESASNCTGTKSGNTFRLSWRNGPLTRLRRRG
jgi:hypothetical protein